MLENRVKDLLRDNRPVVGTWVTLGDPAVVELLGLAGYDFALIDMEHANLGNQTVGDHIRAANLAGVTALVRIGENRENVILRVMESGAHGVMIPHVTTGDLARQAVQSVKYEPEGIRGISASTRAARWTTVDLEAYLRDANEHTLVVPMVEDREGIENIEDILSEPGVDVVFIGPADLAKSYGVTRERNSTIIRDAIEHAAKAAERIGKAKLGIPIRHSAYDRRYGELVQMGFRFFTGPTDAAMLVKAWKENLRQARES